MSRPKNSKAKPESLARFAAARGSAADNAREPLEILPGEVLRTRVVGRAREISILMALPPKPPREGSTMTISGFERSEWNGKWTVMRVVRDRKVLSVDLRREEPPNDQAQRPATDAA